MNVTSSPVSTELATEAATAHRAGLSEISNVLSALQSGNVEALNTLTVENVRAQTSHQGTLSGRSELAGMFGPIPEGQNFELSSSNLYLGGTMTEARGSGYLACRIVGNSQLSFGVVFIIDLRRGKAEDPWMVSALKVQISWVEGDKELRPTWRFPAHERIWTIGDPLHVIVSEVDAPWHVYPDNLLRPDVKQEVEDTYARYSWGIDQADIGLLTGSYTEDAAGVFTPMGPLSGRHAIVGVQKDFRRAWPWMQHYGQVLASAVDGDEAAMIVGRSIPQSNLEPGTFGAYYPLRLRRHGALWQISWFEYRPGWFNAKDVDLDRLLAVTMSGEGDRTE